MRRTAAAALALGVLLSGCGGDHHRVPSRGPVLRHDHYPMSVVTTPPMCSGNPPVCFPGSTSVIPEHWSVTVRDSVNVKWTGEVDVDVLVYAACDRPKVWPDCWKDANVT